MRCAKCEFENRECAKFCGKCRAKLCPICPQCNSENSPQNLFCDECGGDLGGAHKKTPPPDYAEPASYTPKHLTDKILTTRSSLEGERKLVTVLFADVADYTSLSEQLDPEEVHQIMDGCFRILMDEIHGHEGTINQFTGDGVMALFGAPVAHEDHAQRACRAALSIQTALGEYGVKIEKERAVPFAMRIGLNSGPVIVGAIGDDLRMDYTAVGDTTNLAARVQQTARPGEVWLSEETHSIVRGYFEEEAVGEVALKGKTEPQKLFRLLAKRPEVRTRFEAGLEGGVTDFVGRKPEMESLRAAFQGTQGGEAQVVDVVGEAGVGKSRLVFEFQRFLGTTARFLTGVCVHYGRSISFLPLVDIVRGAFGITEGMTEAEVGKRIDERTEGELTPLIPFYRNLLSLPVEDAKFQSLNPEGRKFGTFDAVKNLLLSLSEEQPLVLFLEDVHWIDQISQEFFTYFSRCIREDRVLMLSAYRPEGDPPWAQGAHYQKIKLETLSTRSSARLVRNILGGVELDPDVERKIVEKTGGSPFFVEETVRELLDRGDLRQAEDRYVSTCPIDELEIPSTVQGVLAARMDRLSEDLKGTMQVASVIGRDFAYKILTSITELGDDVRTRLTNLVGLEILYEKALYPELEYIFKHALTQEVAYESLLKQRRRELHGRIAETIEELYAGKLEPHYELLAHHWERSGNAEKAVEYLAFAGKKSLKNKAIQTACDLFARTLELAGSARVSTDPKTAIEVHRGLAEASLELGDIETSFTEYERAASLARKEGMVGLEMRALAGATVPISYTSKKTEEKERFFDQGMARAREVGTKGIESFLLWGKSWNRYASGRFQEGYLLVLEATRMASQAGDPRWILPVARMGALVERWAGRPAKTVELTEGVLETLRSALTLSNLSGDIFIRGLGLADMGRIDEAMALFREGIDICEKFGGEYMLGRLYNSLGFCYGQLYAVEEAWKLNSRSVDVSRNLIKRYPMSPKRAAEVVAQANVNLMENLFDRGDSDEAWDLMKSREEEWRSPDYDVLRALWQTRMHCLSAEILLQRGALDEAETTITRNLEMSHGYLKKVEGRSLRLLGEVQVRRGEHDNAVASMREAIQVLKDVGNPRQIWQAHASLASAYEKMKRRSEARDQWGAAVEVVQKTASGLSDRQLREGFLNSRPIREMLANAGG